MTPPLRASRMRSVALLLALWATLILAPAIHAQDCAETFVPPPQSLNVCERLVRELVVDRILPREINQCRSGFECIAIPQCCIPGFCSTLPECVVVTTIDEIVCHVYHAGDVYCDFREMSPKELMLTFLEQRLVDPDSGAAAAPLSIGLEHLSHAFSYGEHAMRCRADALPTPIIRLVEDLIAHTPGSGFSPADLRAVRIVERGGFPSNQLLREGYAAITLKNTVIFRPALYRALMGEHGFFTRQDLRERRVPGIFVQAIDTLVHELVHVRQYRELGERDFLTIYFQQMAYQGYEHAPLEDEAYAWGSEVAHHTGHYQCLRTAWWYQELSAIREQDLGLFPCTLPTAMLMSIL